MRWSSLPALQEASSGSFCCQLPPLSAIPMRHACLRVQKAVALVHRIQQ